MIRGTIVNSFTIYLKNSHMLRDSEGSQNVFQDFASNLDIPVPITAIEILFLPFLIISVGREITPSI